MSEMALLKPITVQVGVTLRKENLTVSGETRYYTTWP